MTALPIHRTAPSNPCVNASPGTSVANTVPACHPLPHCHKIQEYDHSIVAPSRNLKRIESRQARIGIVGMGYVGLPLALLFSGERFQVTGFDIATDKVDQAQRGRLVHRAHSPP